MTIRIDHEPAATIGVYGAEHATYYVTETGRVWLVQSDDRVDLPVEVSALPGDVERQPDAACVDLDLSGVDD